MRFEDPRDLLQRAQGTWLPHRFSRIGERKPSKIERLSGIDRDAIGRRSRHEKSNVEMVVVWLALSCRNRVDIEIDRRLLHVLEVGEPGLFEGFAKSRFGH